MSEENSDLNQLKVIQGRRLVFERVFHDGAGSPVDPDNFGIGNVKEPNFVIRSPKNVQVYFSVGDRISQGKYRFTWDCPIDSISGEGWQIEYGMTIQSNYRSKTEKLYVIDIAEVQDVGANLYESEQRDSIVFYLSGMEDSYILEILSNDGYLVDPIELAASIMYENDTNPLYVNTLDNDGLRLLSQGKYEMIIPPMDRGDYLIIYRYKIDSSSRIQSRVLKMKIVAPIVFGVMPELRMLIDKAQKSMNKIQGYTDADLLMAMDMSTDFFNSYPPVSRLCLESFIMNYRMLFITGASIWALRSQLVMEIDLSFDYSGQTISLNYDHKSDISSMIQSLLDDYKQMLEKIKVHMALDAAAGGSTGYRMYPPTNTYMFNDTSIGGGSPAVPNSRSGGGNCSGRGSSQQKVMVNTNDLYLWSSVNKRSTPGGPQNPANMIGNPRLFPPVRFH